MKTIRLYTIAIIMFLVGFSSCSEDFLEIKHTDIVTPDVFFLSKENAEMGLNGIYDLLLGEWSGGDVENNWNQKPQKQISNFPTMDIQGNGVDLQLNTFTVNADFYMFGDSWRRCYRAIDRTNQFLANLEKINPAFLEGEKEVWSAEARALRAWFYMFLVQNWGGVPMLMTGESYSTHPGKQRASPQEAWDLIIEDFEYAREHLQWQPRNGEKGRVTKGMVKSYLGLCYMYQKRWDDAKKELKEVIDSGVYDLNPCYAYNWVIGKGWTMESIWEINYPEWDYMHTGAQDQHWDAVWYAAQMSAATEYGGWGPAYTTYEFVWSHEPGDRRLEYNVVQFGDLHLAYASQTLGVPGSAQIGASNNYAQPFVDAEIVPNNFSQKIWKYHPVNRFGALPITYLRYAGVLLNYAECCFETGADAEGWEYIKKVRDRAWGKFEMNAVKPPAGRCIEITLNTDPTIEASDAQTYYSTYKRTAGYNGGYVNTFIGWMPNNAGTGDSIITTPVGSTQRRIGLYERKYYEFPVAYTPYSIPVWKVALIMERRHEHFDEYSNWQDLCRMGLAKIYLDAEYPVNNRVPAKITPTGTHEEQVNSLKNFDYTGKIGTMRENDFYDYQMLLPIPTTELDANPALTQEDQNPGW